MEVSLINPLTLDQTLEVAARVEKRNIINGVKRGSGFGTGQTRHKSLSIYGRGLASSVSYASRSNMESNQTNGSLGLGLSNSLSTSTQVNKGGSTKLSGFKPHLITNLKIQLRHLTNTLGVFRQLTERELQDKKSKGLCFKCDGKWETEHLSRRKELTVILIDEYKIGEKEEDRWREEMPRYTEVVMPEVTSELRGWVA